jgi:hypothetical protein
MAKGSCDSGVASAMAPLLVVCAENELARRRLEELQCVWR